MWSSWFDDAKKRAADALQATSLAVTKGIQIAKDKASEISANAADVMKEYVTGRPEDLTYISSNIIAMGFPGWPKNPNPSIRYNSREVVAGFLEKHHKDHYMIFNLSDEVYESILFGDHIVSYDLHGMPAPSLGMLMKMCIAMETWLADDENNVVVVHCLTGKGRTVTVCACLLAWLGWVENCSEALHLCCDRRGGKIEELTTPSQRRYIQYFSMLLDCVQPKKEPLLLKSIKLTDVPLRGPNPVVQVDVFNCGMLVFATRVSIPQEAGADEDINHTVEVVCGRPIRGNIILRCRQLRDNGVRTSLCRCMIHTGYINGAVFRLTKDQLDGATNDPRCPDTMSLELALDASQEEYVADASVNRMEVYESLLFDSNSALWREVLHRKEGRSTSDVSSSVEKPGANASASAGAGAAANGSAKVKGDVFDIDSEEEDEPVKAQPVPKKDPARDYMTELAMLESSLSQTQMQTETVQEKGLTEAEQQNLDSIMQELDIESDEDDVDPTNLDLNDLAGSIDLDEDDDDVDDGENDGAEVHDYSAEFGV